MRSGPPERNSSGENTVAMSFENVDLVGEVARVQFARDLVAIMNAGGGQVLVGVDRSGHEIGVDDATAGHLTQTGISAIVEPFITPDVIKVDVRARPIDDGRTVVEVDVAEPSDVPIVFTTAGSYQIPDDNEGTEIEVFGSGSVVVAHKGRARPAKRDDFRRWTTAAVDRERARLQEQLAVVLEAPAGSKLRLLTDDEVRDDPSYFLARSADMFRQRPERVLGTGDLQYLWLHRSALTLDRASSELLVQSALRKRATLFLWLAVLDLSPSELKAQLWAALEMRDRDKSDAARSILQVASLIADEDDYRDLQRALADADYTHMRSAAELWPALSDARDALAATADRGLRTRSDAALLELADEIVAAGGSAVLRQAPPIGLEVLTRKLERSVRA
ncbi:MAG: AlbA family DNA-binding domain-containing protein [Acidimicrobiales bacterium]